MNFYLILSYYIVDIANCSWTSRQLVDAVSESHFMQGFILPWLAFTVSIHVCFFHFGRCVSVSEIVSLLLTIYIVLLFVAGLHKCRQSVWRWTSPGYVCVAEETWERGQVWPGTGWAWKDSEDQDDGKQGAYHFTHHYCLYSWVACDVGNCMCYKYLWLVKMLSV